jgi:molybdopterin biosynthesis enzyme MoaB
MPDPTSSATPPTGDTLLIGLVSISDRASSGVYQDQVLPGQPKAIAETLEGMRSATPPVAGIFAAVPYCIDLIGGPYIETDDTVCAAFRPKSAQRQARGAGQP